MLGKILVFVHVGLSLVFASWALALYTNRVDWTARKGTAGAPDGLLATRQAEYNQLATGALRPADFRARAALPPLVFNEYWVPLEQTFYSQQLEFLRTKASAQTPAKQVGRGPEGFPISTVGTGADLVQLIPLARKGRDDEPLQLQSLLYYKNEIEARYNEIKKADADLKAAAEEDKGYTAQLIGTDPRGLQARLKDEFAKREAIKAELAELRPKYLNASVELNYLNELRERLESRLKELERTVVSQQPRD